MKPTVSRMKGARAIGWVAVTLVTLVSGFWAFWGVNEAFHEGWSKPHLWMRLLQVLAYLSPVTVLCVLTVLGIRWPRLGRRCLFWRQSSLRRLIIWDDARFDAFITATLTAVPALVGLLFLVGRPTPKRAAYAVSVGIPLLMVVGFGAEPIVRVNSRFDDGDRGSCALSRATVLRCSGARRALAGLETDSLAGTKPSGARVT